MYRITAVIALLFVIVGCALGGDTVFRGRQLSQEGLRVNRRRAPASSFEGESSSARNCS